MAGQYKMNTQSNRRHHQTNKQTNKPNMKPAKASFGPIITA